MSSCHKLRAEREQKDAPVQLVSTLSSTVTQDQVNSTVVQKPQEVDPRLEGHCSLVTLVRPDHSRHIIPALRDTGALQSLVSQQSVTGCDYESVGEFRLIPVVGSLLTKTYSQMTPTQTEDLTSRRDFDDVFSNTSGKATSWVHHVV